jgi:exosortase E/protease (VPEID-CTERM system)
VTPSTPASEAASAAASSSKFRPGLPVRLAILIAAFLLEKLFLNEFVDFEGAQAAQGFGAIVRVAQHWGFRFAVALGAAVALFAYVRAGPNLKAAAEAVRTAPLRVGWILAHLLCIALLAPLSYSLYRYTATDLSFALVVGIWIVVGAAGALAAVLAMAPGPLWLSVARALGPIWWYAALAALLGTAAMQSAQMLWAPTAALTFDMVARILTPLVPSLTADPATLVIRTDRFAIQVAEICSGLEGMGLMLAFCVAWLTYFRREYYFPRALLLIPLGILVMFALNVVRISALLLIGHAGYPDVAIYGFHSQAGWIAFNAAAGGLVFFSRRSTWLNRSASLSTAPAATDNPTAAYLMPLLAILAVGMVSHAMSGGFETFYPLRLIAGLIALGIYGRRLAALDWRWSWRGPLIGAMVFLLWMIAAHFLMTAAPMPSGLIALSPAARGLWIASRLTASILTVPIAEELAYRGYLMRRIGHKDFEEVPFQRVRWPALCVSAIVFGSAHGALWLPGIAAGLAFGFVIVRRGRIGEGFIAHATANALIAAAVLGWDQWQLW